MGLGINSTEWVFNMIEKENYHKQRNLLDRDSSLNIPKAPVKDTSIGKIRNSSLNAGFSINYPAAS